MFSINTCPKGCQKPLLNCFIIVNGQKCHCNKSFAQTISPIVQDFYKNKKNDDLNFTTEIQEDPSNKSESPLNSIYQITSKLFRGEEIICQEDNLKNLDLIGKHFRIQAIINKIEEYQNYLKMISSHLKESADFREMIKLEKMLLFEMNETNIETKVKEYESLIKKIPTGCFIHFVINICAKKFNITNVDTNEFVIKIIQNVDKIVPGTLPQFLSKYAINSF